MNLIPWIVSAVGHEQAVLGRRVEWLPDMDSNHDKEIQNLRCCHYTIGQEGWEIEGESDRVKVSKTPLLTWFFAARLPNPGFRWDK